MNTIKSDIKHTKYKLTVWKIQSLILMIKMIVKRKLMSWLGCTGNTRKNKNSIIFRKNPISYLGT